jgi:hypothetical protein
MITYTFENNIINVTFSGKISIDEIRNFIEEFKVMDNLPKEVFLLYNLKDAKLEFETKDIKIISQFAEEATKNYTKVKSALVVEDPKNTAYTTLFSNRSEEKRTQRKIFSTKEAALKWLQNKL